MDKEGLRPKGFYFKIGLPMKCRMVTPEQLQIEDSPWGFWLFYSFFVVIGGLGVFISLTAAPDLDTAVLCSGICFACVVAGCYMFQREPASVVIVDRQHQQIRICRWHPMHRWEQRFHLSELTDIIVATSSHSEGGEIYQLRMILNGTESVPISLFWYQNRTHLDIVVADLQAILNPSAINPQEANRTV